MSCSSRRQKTVALSSCEAESMAACEAAREAIWESTWLEELGFREVKPVTILTDSQSALQLIVNPVFHDKTKHIQGRMHFVREHVQARVVTFKKVETARNPADLLTKAVPAQKTSFCCKEMGLH